MTDNRFYVYIYLDPSKLPKWVPIYVGKGTGGRDRQHLAPFYLNDGTYFHNKLRKLIRQDFNPQPIQPLANLTEEEAFTWEEGLIKLYGRRDLKTGILYNLTDGGEGTSGYKHTDEQLKVLRNRGPVRGEYKGVSKVASGKYIALIYLDKTEYLGIFNASKEAARAYDEAVVSNWGRDYYLNFPKEWDGTKCLRELVKKNSHELSLRMSGPKVGKYKGVERIRCGKYPARIRLGKKSKHLGAHPTSEKAAYVYDQAVIKHRGHGWLNFPHEGDYTGFWDPDNEHYRPDYLGDSDA